MSEKEFRSLNNSAAERDLLAAIIKSENAFLEISDQILSSDFVDPLNRALFITISHIYSQNGDPKNDPILVSDLLPEEYKSKLQERGGWEYLDTLSNLPMDP